MLEVTHKAMNKAYRKSCDIGSLSEEMKGYQWVFCQLCFTEDEKAHHENTEHNEADDFW
jgi:hypothetical protein